MIIPEYRIEKIISKSELAARVQKLAEDIRRDFEDSKDLVFIGILKGSIIFIADLLRAVNLESSKIDFMFISSYGNDVSSSGNIKIIKDLDNSVENKDVIIVEDIVDTGLTMHAIVNLLKQRKPKSLKICSLLSKPVMRKVNCKIDYLGFTIDDYFIVGYGIDYAQKYRSLSYIGKIIFNKE